MRPHSAAFASAMAFDDLDDLGARGDAFCPELEEGRLRSGAGFIGVLEDAEFAAANRAAAGVAIAAARAGFVAAQQRTARLWRPEPAQGGPGLPRRHRGSGFR